MKLGPLIEKHAGANRLRVDIVAAQILQESSGNALASRYEPGFYRKYLEGKTLTNHVPKSVPEALETHLRATSFGLLQIMGQVAREQGFKGEWLTQLYDPEVNLAICTKLLAKYIAQKNGDLRAGLLRYNGGGDPAYPDRIFKRIQNREHLTLF